LRPGREQDAHPAAKHVLQRLCPLAGEALAEQIVRLFVAAYFCLITLFPRLLLEATEGSVSFLIHHPLPLLSMEGGGI